jgi:hypothetical protein
MAVSEELRNTTLTTSDKSQVRAHAYGHAPAAPAE